MKKAVEYLDYYAYGKNHKICFDINKYSSNKNLAIQMIVNDDGYFEPWSMLTVNIDKLSDDCACIDTNNNGIEILTWLEANNLAKPTIIKKQSGFCEYPVYRFNMEEVRKHCVEEV